MLDERLAIELAGVAHEDVDPGEILGLGNDYLQAFRFIVGERAMNLVARGFFPQADRTAITFSVSDSDQAREVAEEISHEIGHSQTRPLRTLARRIEMIPVQHAPVVSLVRQQWRAPLIAQSVERPATFYELTTRRVVIEKTGGRRPMVRVVDVQTNRGYTLVASRETAAEAGGLLYRRADARMRVRRRQDTLAIVGGELLGLHAVPTAPLTFEDMATWWNGRYEGKS